jgi:hypothetical protein
MDRRHPSSSSEIEKHSKEFDSVETPVIRAGDMYDVIMTSIQKFEPDPNSKNCSLNHDAIQRRERQHDCLIINHSLTPKQKRITMFFAARSSLLATRHVSRYFSSGRPFQILGLQQIAPVGRAFLTKEPLTELWQDVFGLTKVKTFVSESENVDEDILMLGDKNPLYAVEVDLMTPVDAPR